MKTLLSLCLCLAATLTFASKPEAVTNIKSALKQAKSENKVLFLQFGRKECEHCQELRALIHSNKVALPESQFVYADVNCDDPATRKAFQSKFKISGKLLPMVVIAAPDGTQLAFRSGPGSQRDFNKLIRSAVKANPASAKS